MAKIPQTQARNGPINAAATPRLRAAPRARGRPLPEGPFQGVSFLLTDLNDLEGMPRSMEALILGERLLRRDGRLGSEDPLDPAPPLV